MASTRNLRAWASLAPALLLTVGVASLAASSPAATTAHHSGPGRTGATAASSRTARANHGTVRVLYAGSLEAVMNGSIAAAFHRATGYTVSGFPAGSQDLASDIRGRVEQGDVFISASPKVNATLEGRSNGRWVSWYAPFATTRLVLGYNRSSSFAGALRRGPWYRVITRPGFRLGFTDPALDPKGQLAVAALDSAAARYDAPALRAIATDSADLFPEQDLVGRLQAGQLDAGFFYTVEASAARIPMVSLSPIDETATYTLTVLNRAPDPRGGEAFVRFLLSRRGTRLLQRVGLVPQVPIASGRDIPDPLRTVIRR